MARLSGSTIPEDLKKKLDQFVESHDGVTQKDVINAALRVYLNLKQEEERLQRQFPEDHIRTMVNYKVIPTKPPEFEDRVIPKDFAAVLVY